MVSLLPKDITVSKLNYFTMKFSGLINRDSKTWFLFHSALLQINGLFTTVTAIAELFLGKRDAESLVEAFSLVVVCVLAELKTILFNLKKKEIIKLFDRLENIRLKTLEDEENKHFIIEAESSGKRLYLALFISLPCYPIISFVLNSISEILSGFSEKHLIYKHYIPWSTEQIRIHILTNAIETVATFIYISVYHGIYFMEITFTLYITAFIKSLQNTVINKGMNKEKVYEHHKVINQLINDYKEIWSLLMYMQIVIAPLMPCGFIVSSLRALQRDDISKSFENIIRAILCLMPCFISCCCGQLLITQMEKLHEAAYMNNWYEQNPNTRKNLLHLMTRTTTTASVNYRLFIRFDHVLLSKVLQVIYSYTMLMVNIE